TAPGVRAAAPLRRSSGTTCHSTSRGRSATSKHSMWRRTWIRARGPTSRTRSTIGRMGMRRPTWRTLRARPHATGRAPRAGARHSGRTLTSSSPTEEVLMLDLNSLTTPRRGFLGRLAAGAATLGLGGLVAPTEAVAERKVAPHTPANPEFEAWLNKITGRHKMVYDVPEPNS